MIRRVVAALAVVLLVGAAALSLGAKSDDGGSKTYNLLDNAFGLTEGGDFKVAGCGPGRPPRSRSCR